MSSFNPFSKTSKNAVTLLKESFGVGFDEFDFGGERWDENRRNKAGELEPGWVPDPKIKTVCVIQFSPNEGQGTGKQVIPVSEFPEYIRELRSIIDSGYATDAGQDRSQYVPTYEHARQSFKMVQPKKKITKSDGTTRSVTDRSAPFDMVSVRCTGGQGSKPIVLHRDEFEQVVELLEGVSDNLDQLVEEAQKNYDQEIAR